jgi:DNA-binding NarL/FixJ family response regulator
MCSFAVGKTHMSNKKFTILIVDDNSGFISRMKTILDEVSSFINIHTASNYDEAFVMLAEMKPNLVMLDIRLPGKSGLSLLKKINDSSSRCKVIMNSNYTNDHYRQQCQDLGADYFLDKTNDFETVPELIRQIAMESLMRADQHCA